MVFPTLTAQLLNRFLQNAFLIAVSTAFELDLLSFGHKGPNSSRVYILTGKPLRVTLLPKRARLRGDRRARLAAGGVCATHAAGLDAAADAPAHTLEHAPELLDTTAFYY